MQLKVELIAHGDEATCAKAALTCTSADSVHEVFAAQKDHLKVLERVFRMGHTSVSEHMWFTFIASGISRSASHQLVRTRMASYSQRSQRYVKEGDFAYVVPPSIAANQEALEQFKNVMQGLQAAYGNLLYHDIPAEDARFVLPNACETQIVISINARALIHFAAERLCTCAQWEIRALCKEMVRLATEVAPTLGQFMVPKCMTNDPFGVCFETAKRHCGRRPHYEDVQLVTKHQFNLLCSESDRMSALEAHGVDNWEGYSEAMQSLEGGK